MIYTNPIIHADFSDPDVIRVGDDFYMVSSSFNHLPGVPILHSKNLVDWEIINYVFDEIPFKRFDRVCHGDGAWAPSIRYYNHKYYVVIPFPDEGIYVSETTNPYEAWSPLRCLISGKGYIDPCPIWIDDKCYLVVAYAKSRIGFNSVLGLFEVSIDLKENLSLNYQIIYDGHKHNPTIEGPKFYFRNGYYYILCPAGSVRSGWQTALRSKNIYGPYESKIVLFQGDTLVNGPHQGALIDLDDNDNWAFIHFQDKRAYGRIIHLQPVTWYDDWPIIGDVKDPLVAGVPVSKHEYLVDKKSNYKIPTIDRFEGNKLSLVWQTPANKKSGWFEVNNGLYLNSIKTEEQALHLVPQTLLQKVMFLNFDGKVNVEVHLENNDEIGFVVMGEKYNYISILKENDELYLCLKTGNFMTKEDTIIYKEKISTNNISFNLKARNFDLNNFWYKLGYNGNYFKNKFIAEAGRWIGTKIGIFAKSDHISKGYGIFTLFEIKPKK